MDDSYDLTKKSTLEKLARVGVFGIAGTLFTWGKDLLGSTSDVSPEKQAEAAARVIRAGRENGASRIRIKVTKEVGAKLQVTEPQSGINISGKVGSDGTMELDVEYK